MLVCLAANNAPVNWFFYRKCLTMIMRTNIILREGTIIQDIIA
ncbi:hypothetical protein BLGI_2528 [Brevibacillus laterosporus GI-9]|nr:hypothetical protein BLGI_2528 [Brevibacillus laterosporus GI-9]